MTPSREQRVFPAGDFDLVAASKGGEKRFHQPSVRDLDIVAEALERNAGWTALWRFAYRDGRIVVHSVALEPTEMESMPPGGVSTTLLHELSPQAARERAAAAWADLPSGLRAILDLSVQESTGQRPDEAPLADRKRRGRPPLSDELLQLVAKTYAREAPFGRGLYRRMAAHPELARHGERPETMRDWVRAARKRGFITDEGDTR